ncbi:putative gastrula zinc finger protein XlCGF57.1-like [Apostichopus japonicus]|uniref:Putative gastrula zinc finger protein XlCGF57.1-like n=1 Tax=Stichopus japonicus TaxID=307972 RepID=A0A2G8KA79_STIJA|nr:putative gastrula zinc finger protein XlCGF57.1-like [Apostichopus japonicus]
MPASNSVYLKAINDSDVPNGITSENTVSAASSNPVTIISVDEAVTSHKGSEVTTGSSDNDTVQFVDIQGAVVVSSAFPSSVSSSLSDEQTLMKAIDSIMDMCPAPEMGESPVLPETMYTLPTTTTTPNELPRTKVPFIRNLTEEERKKMFKFQSDSERENQAALESGNACLCEQCGKVFGRRNLKKHIQTHQKGRERDLICDICGKGFFFKNGLRNHQQIHNKKTSFVCRYCPRSYKTFFGRTIHERLHFSVYPETCPKCGGKFKCNRDLKKHLARGRCDGTVEVGKSSVLKKKNTDGSTTCHICKKVLRNGSLPAHLLMHERKMFTCPVCNKVMAFGTRYYHLKIHENKKDHKCSVCGKDFSTKQALQAHFRVHTGERPIKCRYCDRTFARYGPRAVHEATHTGERSFKCTICGKSWKDRATYWLHMKKHHPGEPLYYRRLSAQINSQRLAKAMQLPASPSE